MNRNTESRFHTVPQIEIRRSKFDLSHEYKTTYNEGDIIPIRVAECNPSENIKIDLNGLVRMSTPLYPVMGSAYTDYYAFFVPSRILWEHWVNLMGENTSSFWAEKTEYTTPKTTAPSGGWNIGTIADYMGIPTGIENLRVNSMIFRGYAKIWNDWFRDENLQQPVTVSTDDADTAGSNTGNNLSDAEAGGLPLKAARYHDYFSSCLPAPLKAAEPVSLPINFAQQAPIFTKAENTVTGAQSAIKFLDSTGRQPDKGRNLIIDNNGQLSTGVDTSSQGNSRLYPSNLYANIDTNAVVTIEQLRQAVAIQHILEADARGGTRYNELLQNQFGCNTGDARLQRAEYIGGTRQRINVSQVVQSSATTDISPQGNTGAYSMTSSRDKILSYATKEHGYLYILAVTRVDHLYQQGLERMWTRTDRFSYYHPMLANLGEMAVLNQEIYAQGNAKDQEVFGYQEAWADYKYCPNRVTGYMRSTAPQSLDAWHYGDKYDSLPMLSSSWIQEGTENIDRTLAVQSEVSHQFIADYYFDETWVRPMPVYSVPGLHTL